jgi:hypothetical protein
MPLTLKALQLPLSYNIEKAPDEVLFYWFIIKVKFVPQVLHPKQGTAATHKRRRFPKVLVGFLCCLASPWRTF